MYDPKSHLRARVTRLMLHYRDSFPYMETGATVMYGPLLLPKLWLSSLTRGSNPDLWPDNQTFQICTMLFQLLLKQKWICYLSPCLQQCCCLSYLVLPCLFLMFFFYYTSLLQFTQVLYLRWNISYLAHGQFTYKHSFIRSTWIDYTLLTGLNAEVSSSFTDNTDSGCYYYCW